jgi:hypothetical protein
MPRKKPRRGSTDRATDSNGAPSAATPGRRLIVGCGPHADDAIGDGRTASSITRRAVAVIDT